MNFYHDKDVISSTEESQTFPSSPNNVRFRLLETIVPIVDEIPTEGKTTAKRCCQWTMLAFPSKDKLLCTYTMFM